MPDYAISVGDVLDGFSTAASRTDLLAYIAVIDQADACLTGNGVSDVIGRQLKILGVRALANNASDGGAVTEQTAVSGASRKFADRPSGQSQYMATLRQIDRHGCVMAVVSRNGSTQLRNVGRRTDQPSGA